MQRLSARTADAEGGFGIELGHMVLLVQGKERMIADVGFGESFIEPLRLDERGEQVQERGKYRIVDDLEHLTYPQQEKTEWKVQYIFTLKPYSLADFQEACNWTQTSPLSIFTQRRVCSLATLDGRITLSNTKMIITSNGSRQERQLESEAEYHEVLWDRFGIVL